MAVAAEASTKSEATAEDEDEAFYYSHREELLEVLKGGTGKGWGEVYARLEPRDEDGVGILNQGATCYMNSLLQVLFHTPEFRLAIYGFNYDPSQHGEESRCIPLQLQRLFSEMQLANVSAVSTTGLVTACGLSDHTGEQHDVQEMCRVLFDALSRSSTPLRHEIERLYAGKTVQYIRSAESFNGKVYDSSRKETILDLQLPIMGCKTLEEAMQKLVEPEELNGDNQWLCGDLGRKVDALKGMEFESLPVILHLQLLRFVFDLATMKRKKLTDNLSIPLELDLQHLLGADSGPAKYEFSGMCIQMGQAGGGHYIAKVRDSGNGHWLNANDKSVKRLTEEQVSGLFRPRSESSSSSSEAACRQDTTVALNSTDAYYLVYRKVTLEGNQVSNVDVPSALATEISVKNEHLKLMQRAYAIHRNLLSINIFAPSAAELALKSFVARRLDGLLAKGQAENDGEHQSVRISVPRGRSVGRTLVQALGEFAKRAAEDANWTWAAGLAQPDCSTNARLRKYAKNFGFVTEPVDEHSPIGDAFGANASNAESVAILELCAPGRSFEAWSPGMFEIVVCRWDSTSRGISLASGDLHLIKFAADEQSPVESNASGEKAVAAPPAQQEQQAETEAPAYDPYSDEMPDLFGDSQVQLSQPATSTTEMSVLVGKIRQRAAVAFGLENLALVPMTGSAAGKVLCDDDCTLAKSGVYSSDVLCVEAKLLDAELQSPPEYQLVRNSAHLHFNHPDRPEFAEEFKLSISKDSTVAQLKAAIGEQLGLDGDSLHLRRDSSKAQIKDEDNILREVGLDDATYVFVGHGAPVPPDHTMLQVYVYSAQKGCSVKTKDASFSVAAKGAGSVKYLRKLLLEPLLAWVKEIKGHGAESSGSELWKSISFPLEGLTWRRLRLRDAQAGKQYAILRDERTLRSSLLGFQDGRQVAIQVLEHDEELDPQEVLISVYPWLVQKNQILGKSEIVVSKNQSLNEFRDVLTTKFRKSKDDEEIRDAKTGEDDEIEDTLEIAVMPSATMAVSVRQSLTLKWSNCRLNAQKPEDLERPLSEFKEVRDGVVLIMRSKADAAKGPPAGQDAAKGGKSAGKGPGKAPGKAKAKSFSSVEEGAAAMAAKSKSKPSKPRTAERGIHIEVVCPVGETGSPRQCDKKAESGLDAGGTDA